MKKLSLLIIVALCLSFSCSDDDKQQAQTKMYKQDVSIDFKNALKDFLKSSDAGRIMSDEGVVEFDVDHMQAITNDETSTVALVANQKGFSLDNQENYGLVFYSQENEIIANTVIKTSKNADGTKNVEYLALDGSPIIKLVVNETSRTSNTQYVTPQAKNCGQRTMDCVNDAYTNSGWLSVTLTVITMFDPTVAGGVIAGCGIACLVSHNKGFVLRPTETTPPTFIKTAPVGGKKIIAMKSDE